MAPRPAEHDDVVYYHYAQAQPDVYGGTDAERGAHSYSLDLDLDLGPGRRGAAAPTLPYMLPSRVVGAGAGAGTNAGAGAGIGPGALAAPPPPGGIAPGALFFGPAPVCAPHDVPTALAPAPTPAPAPAPRRVVLPEPMSARGATLRDPLAALALVLALAYLAYLTAASGRTGNVDFVFSLARALVSARARAVVFEFPLIRWLLARFGGPLSVAAAAATLPVSFVALLLVRVAGRAVVVVSCFGALAAVLGVALRGAAFFFASDAVAAALFFVGVAFVALVLIYMLYLNVAALVDYGRLFEDAAAIVFAALPALCVATLVIGALYVGFVAWLGVTLAAILTSDIGALVAGRRLVADGAPNGLDLGLGLGLDAGAIPVGAAEHVVFVGGSAANVYFCVLMGFWGLNILGGAMRVAVARGAHAWSRGASANAGVLGGLARALTLSLGSLAIAAFLVAVVEWTHAVLSRTRFVVKRLCLAQVAALLKVPLLALRYVIRYVNSYVYVELADSGCTFFEAGARVRARFCATPARAFVSYAATAHVVAALRAAIAWGALVVAVLVAPPRDAAGAPLALLAALRSRQALAAFCVGYTIAMLPTACLETATHARIVHDAATDAAERAPAPAPVPDAVSPSVERGARGARALQ